MNFFFNLAITITSFVFESCILTHFLNSIALKCFQLILLDFLGKPFYHFSPNIYTSSAFLSALSRTPGLMLNSGNGCEHPYLLLSIMGFRLIFQH